MKILLNELQVNQIMELLNEFPIKSTATVQKIVAVLNEGVQKDEEPKKKGDESTK